MILHIDMDAFFASIEQAINPRLRGRPVIVGSRPNKLYTVVCAASYEAKALGIDSGMPTKEAFNICPEAAFVAADQGKYIWTSEQILELLQGYGFQTNYASIDEFQLDIRDHPDPSKLAQDIQEQIYANFNITASIGIAKNYLLSKLASKLNKPNGIAVITEENLEEILGKTPAKKLCGVGEKTNLALEGLEIRTCLDLYRKDAFFLKKTFGQNGLNLYLSLHAEESLEGQENPDFPKSVGHSYTLPRASGNPVFLKGWLRLLSEMVAERLRSKNLAAKAVHLWLNCPETGNFSGQKSFQIATDDGQEIFARCLKIMAKKGKIWAKVRAFGVTCAGLEPAKEAYLFEEEKRRGALLKTIDRINGRFGDGAIYPAITILTRKMA